jgi:hypothetical protein
MDQEECPGFEGPDRARESEALCFGEPAQFVRELLTALILSADADESGQPGERGYPGECKGAGLEAGVAGAVRYPEDDSE